MKKISVLLIMIIGMLISFPAQNAWAQSGGEIIVKATSGGVAIKDITFTIERDRGDGVVYKDVGTTDGSGNAIFTNLPMGNYTVAAQSGTYILDQGQEMKVAVTPDKLRVVHELKFTNPNAKGKVAIFAKDDKGSPIKGVSFDVTFNGGSKNTYVTNDNGTIVIENASMGTYVITLSKVVAGYDLPTSKTVVVDSTALKTAEFKANTPVSKFDISRISDEDRIRTAIAISKKSYGSSDTVILVNGNNYPDGLVSGTLAFRKKAPILLTNKDTIRTDVLDEMKRLGATNILIMGGSNSVSTRIEDYLKNSLKKKVTRISGDDRFYTAVKAGDYILGGKKTTKAILVNGNNYPDAIAVSGAASKNGVPIVLSPNNWIPESTIKALKNWGVKQVDIIGGTSSIGTAIEKRLKSMGITVNRVQGSNRYETSVAIARKYFTSNKALVATGTGFADALTGGPYGAITNSPVLLVYKDKLPDAVRNYLKEKGITNLTILGGKSSVEDSIFK